MANSPIETYIRKFPQEVQEKLQRIRMTIQEQAPDAIETMAYGIPTFKQNTNLVHFAAYKNHIGFYPTPSGIEHFKEELSEYEVSKGTVKFPHNKPIPYDLISDIVRFRVKEEDNNE